MRCSLIEGPPSGVAAVLSFLLAVLDFSFASSVLRSVTNWVDDMTSLRSSFFIETSESTRTESANANAFRSFLAFESQAASTTTSGRIRRRGRIRYAPGQGKFDPVSERDRPATSTTA